jgi:type IV secretion system protein VirD4
VQYVGQTLTTAFWFFVFWYGGWALLWSYEQISTPPHPGWWDWALPVAAIFAVLERFSVDLEEQETTAGGHGFWGPYTRQAAVGVIFGLGLLAIGVAAGLVQWLPRPFENEILGITIALSGALTLVIATAGRRRDYPLLSAIYDLAAGLITGATVSWLVLSTRPNIEGNWFTWIGVCAAIGGGLNLWRRSARGGKLVLFLAEMAARSKTIVVGCWWAIVGGLILWFTWNNPLESYASDAGRTAILLFGSGIGLYVLFARGLGPIVSALSLSRLRADTPSRERTATESDLRQAGLMPRHPDAIYLGRFLGDKHERESVGYPGGAHLVTIGPAGSGKGTGLIVPNLSTLRRSILIIDPKGEAAAITARKRAQFGPVIIINPFDVFANELPYLKSNGFNPLAALDPEQDDFTDDCTGIGQALIGKQGRGNGAIFSGSAQDLITALVMHEKFERRERASLANVRTMLTEPFTATGESGPDGLLKTIIEMTTSKCASLRSKTSRFLRDRNSSRDFISIAINETRFLDSPQIQRDLAGAGVDWDRLKREVTTVYVILPADRLDTHANYLRLVVSSALQTLLRSPPSTMLPPVLFMLDEFAQLGSLSPIENAMGIADGLGVQLWPFLQDVSQLKALYQDRWQTFLGNAAALTAFGARDIFTAQYLSARAGNKAVIVETENERVDGSGAAHGRNPQGVRPFKPERPIALPEREMLCIVEPVKKPFMSKAPPYWDGHFSQDLDPSPYRQADV